MTTNDPFYYAHYELRFVFTTVVQNFFWNRRVKFFLKRFHQKVSVHTFLKTFSETVVQNFFIQTLPTTFLKPSYKTFFVQTLPTTFSETVVQNFFRIHFSETVVQNFFRIHFSETVIEKTKPSYKIFPYTLSETVAHSFVQRSIEPLYKYPPKIFLNGLGTRPFGSRPSPHIHHTPVEACVSPQPFDLPYPLRGSLRFWGIYWPTGPFRCNRL
jgi:hypothetical protein